MVKQLKKRTDIDTLYAATKTGDILTAQDFQRFLVDVQKVTPSSASLSLYYADLDVLLSALDLAPERRNLQDLSPLLNLAPTYISSQQQRRSNSFASVDAP